MSRTSIALACLLALTGGAAARAARQSDYDAAVARSKSVMMEDPGQALALARRAEAIAARLPQDRGTALDAARAEWLQGEAWSRLDAAEKAEPILEKALATVVRLAPADRLRGDLLLSRGWVRETRGAIAAGLEDFQHAFLLYRASGEARGEAKALQNIAGIYQDAGDNARSQRYYAQAAEVYRGDPAFALAAYNNVGESLRLLGRYAAAQRQYERALAAARQAKSPLLQANILTNLASTHLLRGDIVGAMGLARQALSLTGSREAEDERPFVWGVLAQIAMARGDLDSAAIFIGRTFKGVDLAQSALRFRDFHKLAADIYAREGRSDLALAHLRAWKRLDDNMRAVAASTNAALMAARFDFSNQNLRIAQLQANRARLHETVLVIVASAVTLLAALMMIGMLSLRRSRNQIRAANRQLAKALQAKSDFLAMTSHEIRTPLNGILGMTQVILADRAIAGPLRTKVELVHGAGETMRALVDDILDLSKMETGKLSIHRAPVALRQLLDEAGSLWRGKAEAKGLTLTLELADCPALVDEDGDRLRQILFNLLSNAVKFTASGAVTLAAKRIGGRLELAVSDTGIGIAPEHHGLIFEKFQQADGSTSRRFGGTGLGLAICRSLADALDGEIVVASLLGEGATFTLRLPLRELEAPAEAIEAIASAATLLLDPNPLTQRIISRSLDGAADPVETVGDVSSLLDRASGGGAQTIIVQAEAAGTALPAILVAVARSKARLIVLYAPTDAIDEDAIGAVAGIALRKPFSREALLAAVAGTVPALAPAA